MYYLNSQSPLIGTGSVDAHINSDGTLGEGSASVDDETLGDVLSAAATVGSGGLTAWSTVAAAHIAGAATQAADLVNANAILADGAAPKPPVDQPPACEAGDGWPQVKKTVSYELTVTPSGYKHDHKILKPLENGQCRVTDPVMDGSYTISPVGGDGGKADKDAIGVSGTITLPKAKDAAPPKQ